MAHFSFQLPETCTGASRDGISFSGVLEMCVIRGKSMLLTEFDLYPVGFIVTDQVDGRGGEGKLLSRSRRRVAYFLDLEDRESLSIKGEGIPSTSSMYDEMLT